ERGLRQSEALYQHVNNLPQLFETIPTDLCIKKRLKVVVYSAKPRPQEDSYMPVFKAGISFGKTIGKVLEVKTSEMSHQENHIRSAIYGCGYGVD
ncbi:MAG: peptidase M22, partial [Eubacterium sp.]